MMRRILGAVAVLVTVVGLMACEPTPPKPTEPSMTLTAKPQSTKPGCGQVSNVAGTVTPAGATPKVVLQRTSGGQWVDWKPVATSRVTGGSYQIIYSVPLSAATLHMRVRSNGGTRFSPGFYVTPKAYDTGQCG